MYDCYVSFLVLMAIVRTVTHYERYLLLSTMLYAVSAVLLQFVFRGVGQPFSPSTMYFVVFLALSFGFVAIYLNLLLRLNDTFLLWWVVFIPGVFLPFWTPDATRWTLNALGA